MIVAEKLSRKDGEILPYMIDYAAGSGHFITEFMHEIQDIINDCDTSKYIEETRKHLVNWQNCHFDWATDYVYGIEKDYRLVKVGKVGCYLHGDGLANVILSDGLANFCNNKEYKGKLRKQTNDGQKDNQQFDIVLSNPPYSVSSFRQTTRDYYTEQDFELYNSLTDNSSEIECLFIERTKQLLKDGGIAGVILPSSIPGILSGVILSMGRVIGESAALLFTAGFAHSLNNFVDALTSSGATLTVALYVYAKEQGDFEISFAIAAILLIMTFIINTSAEIIGKKMKRNKQ